MDSVKLNIYAPGSAGPTGPAKVVVLAVPTGGTHLNLESAEFGQLKSAIDKSIPLMMSVEGNFKVAYRFDIQGSGPSADPSMHVYGPTAANMAGVLFNNQRLANPEIAPQGAAGLAIRAYADAGTIGTAVMRIWSTGG